MLRLATAAASIGILCSGLACQPPAEAKADVKLEKATFAEFEKAVAAHKGHVVVVDVWGEFCPPCKKKFPHVVKVHETFAKDGVAVISLSLDEADNEAAVKAFLNKHNATFQNLMLVDTDDNKTAANRRIEINVPPLLHVFDRAGVLVKTFDGRNTDEEVDAYIRALVEKK